MTRTPETAEEAAVRARATRLGLDAGRARNGFGVATGPWGVVARRQHAIIRWFDDAAAVNAYLDTVEAARRRG